ncbi:hypothetical protein BH23BAC2_BH23BAC2_03710 [soil metagenome]
MRIKFTALFLLLVFIPAMGWSQCAMCRAVLESEDSQTTAEGINQGILYLMVFPYLLMGGITFFIYRMLRKKKASVS